MPEGNNEHIVSMPESSIEHVLELCGHPDWSTKINQLFSMHNGRNPALNDQLFETLKLGANAEFTKVDAFLKTGSKPASYIEIEQI